VRPTLKETPNTEVTSVNSSKLEKMNSIMCYINLQQRSLSCIKHTYMWEQRNKTSGSPMENINKICERVYGMHGKVMVLYKPSFTMVSSKNFAAAGKILRENFYGYLFMALQPL
jgi:hypothetical protein